MKADEWNDTIPSIQNTSELSNGSYIFWKERRLQAERHYELSTNTYLCYLEQEMDIWIRGWIVLDCPVNCAALQRAADDLLQVVPFQLLSHG